MEGKKSVHILSLGINCKPHSSSQICICIDIQIAVIASAKEMKTILVGNFLHEKKKKKKTLLIL